MAEPVYLDFAATTPVDPRVAAAVLDAMTTNFGNPHSRTHERGSRAAQAVEKARAQLAAVVEADPAEVVFTSGATEANNLALLGLAPALLDQGRTHIVSTQIEHKAVLEPLEYLAENGFTVTLIPPETTGVVSAEAVLSAVRPETGLVSVMQVNNETGAIQPIQDIAEQLGDHPAYLHTDAAQGFGKVLPPLRHPRVDLISASGHKLFAPMGVGVLVARRRRHVRPPIQARQFGGSQERGMRSGTVAAPLTIGFGLAAELALEEHEDRVLACRATRAAVLDCIRRLGGQLNSPDELTVPHIASFRVPGLDGDAALLALRYTLAAATGSACTSATSEPSHVLEAMGLSPDEAGESMRWSWGHDAVHLELGGVPTLLGGLQAPQR